MTPPVLPARPLAARAVQRRRQLKLARIRARASLRVPPPIAGVPDVDPCTAAGDLRALGVRVEVVEPTTPWPPAGRVVLSDSTTWLGDLALAATALDRAPADDGGVAVCPVSVRYRMPSGYLRPDAVPGRTADAAATDGLVVEVRCLPAIVSGCVSG